MASASGDNTSIDDSQFEVLEMVESGRNWLEKALDGDLSRKSIPVQVGIGGATGWVAGYVFQKVGKAAATAVGGGLFVLLIGYHTGHLNINWKKIEKDVNKTKGKVASQVEKNAPYLKTFAEQAKQLARKNVIISGGFGAGFLLGMAM